MRSGEAKQGARAPSASLLLTTYEMPRHLEMVLAGLSRQTTHDFEILLCDDGSGAETRTIIEKFARSTSLPFQHFWQENRGFRKCRILNQALRASRGQTTIFLDGDCVPHKDYIRSHLENQKRGHYLAGRRVDLGPKLSGWLTAEAVREGFFDRPRLPMIVSVFQKDSNHLQRTIPVRPPWLRSLLKMDRIDDLLGSNYSVSREDLVAINGFDEEYEGYGREDTDVELRLQNLGLKIKSMKGLALQFHVWHPRREFTPKNDSRLEELKRSGRVRCWRGMAQ